MRGHTHCRAHRDDELGPRAAGAPRGNLNTLRTGEHAHPLPPLDLQRLARQIARDPKQLPYQIGLAAQAIQSRTGDPVKTLIVLEATVRQLRPAVAEALFATELATWLQRLPAAHQERATEIVAKSAQRLDPQQQLAFLRGVIGELNRRKRPNSITGTGGIGTQQPANAHEAKAHPSAESAPLSL
jgi:hypothetical protein